MSLPGGLPPLPKSLSSVSLSEGAVPPPAPAVAAPPVSSSSGSSGKRHHKLPPPPPPPAGPRQPPPPPPRKQTKLDVQLARLRKEMYSLRELDLSLLSQLWSLNESLQEFRTLQEMLSPGSDPEDEGSGGSLYSNLPPLRETPPPPPPPLHHPSSSVCYPLSHSSSSNSNSHYTEL